jgi:hypothetical protein
MVRFACAVALLMLAACATDGASRPDGQTPGAYETRFYGSAGAEKQLTPANSTSPLNPRNVAGIAYATNVADATLFADVMPQSRTWKAHVKLRAEGDDRHDDGFDVGEALVQWKATEWLDLTAGRVIEKWGTGYAWNPTAFVSPRKNPTDASDRRSGYRGVDMVKADAFIRGTTVSLYALDDHAWAARAYRLIGGTDVALHLYRDREGTEQGISVARVFGEALELHGEAARSRLLIGGQYTFRGGTNAIAEFFRSGSGLSAAEWRDFRGAVALVRDEASLRSVNAAYRPLQMGREYAFLRVATPPLSRYGVEGELVAIPSLRDGSSIVRIGLSKKLRQNLNVYLLDTEFLGRRHTELSYMQIERSTVFGARYFF